MALFSEKTEETKVAAGTSPAQFGGALKNVLVQPRVSEKSSRLATAGKYVFNVLKKANKIEVKKAIESHYKVRVTQVNMINTEGKHRNYGKTSGRMSDFKKAIVFEGCHQAMGEHCRACCGIHEK